ncbi:MAG: pyrroline-5-carboxylate reductase, partial [Acetatifactor sp.]|nr:pyrroline-5-carboxylate reductase [Acetatifactor sp.]
MAGAIIRGILKAGLVSSAQIMATGRTKEKLEQLEKELSIQVTTDNAQCAAFADILFLAVKPKQFPLVIGEIKESVKPETLIISIAAGQSIAAIEGMFGKQLPLIRVMPNTPALVGEGMASLSPNALVSSDHLVQAKQIFESIGKAEVVGEELMDAVIGVSGSSPAYVYMFIEALADAGVMGGMTREQAYRFAAQSVYGSAKMVLE